MAEAKYSMSFTAGGLLCRESVEVAKLYLSLTNWQNVRKKVLEDNILQARTQNTAKRIFREISSRLDLLTKEDLAILVEGSYQEQVQILWLAICKRYKFIYDFAVEVIREKFLSLSLEISFEDYNVFFNSKAEWHDELESLTEKTKNKARQVVFKILREVELLSKNNIITPCILAPRVFESICNDDPLNLSIFLITENESKKRLG
ncbi:MAG: DUF1819 family protein [Candidatus Scalindua sp.]